ncbi:MAG: hypothetical protein VXZ40_04340 [Nanoarchaeota archaeon]|nr:hypothetical protein [Nanoarchaeota archaeon]
MNTDYVERVREKPQPKTTKKRGGIWSFLFGAGAALGISQSGNIADYSKESISSASQVVSQKQDHNYVHDFIKDLEGQKFFIDNPRELEDLKGLVDNATKEDTVKILNKYNDIIDKMLGYKTGKSIEERNKIDGIIKNMKAEEGRFLSYISSK